MTGRPTGRVFGPGPHDLLSDGRQVAPVGVAVLDRDGLVLAVKTLQPWTGATSFRWGAVATLEAPAGAPAEGASDPVCSSPSVGTPDPTRWLHHAA